MIGGYFSWNKFFDTFCWFLKFSDNIFGKPKKKKQIQYSASQV